MKMKGVLIGGAVCCISIWASVSFAYEPGTHGDMSDFAAQHSVLLIPIPGTTTTVLQDLGLNSYTDTSHLFPDIQNGEKVALGPNGTDPFTAQKLLTVQQLIRTGAQLEDESGLITGRPLNHFFDPTTGLPLNYNFLGYHQSNFDAPDWAANSHCAGSGQTGLYNPSGDNASDTNQCFSLQDAASYFYNALTAPNSNDRNQQFGDLFLTLGHVMHLVQDMAQPQHVRNDPHCDIWECHLVGKYNPSRYETITYGATGADVQGSAGQYGIVSLPSARSFWSTDQTTNDQRGLAEYTNSNFFSAGSLGLYGGAGSKYSAPIANDGSAFSETIQQVLVDLGRQSNPDIDAECPNTAPCYVSFIATTVRDNYRNVDQVNPKAAAVSLFSGDLVNKGATETFSLNDATYRAAWQFLIPAAIDYSTGLVNYFFRGKLGIKPDPSNLNNYIVSNLSGYALNGSLELYYDDPRGNRTPLPGSKTSVKLAAFNNSQPPASVSLPAVLTASQAKSNTGYTVVFNGTIGAESGGAESGIAGKHRDPDKFYVFIDDTQGTDAYAQAYTSSGVLINSFDVGVPDSYAASLAASDGSIFSAGGFPINTDVIEKVLRDESPIVSYPTGTFIDSIAVNDKNLFVAESTTGADVIDLYDLNGNPEISTSPSSSPAFSLSVTQFVATGLAANDSVLCITGYDADSNGVNSLYSLSTGALVASLQASSGLLGGDYCATTSDRVYVVRQGTPNEVDVYKNDGSAVTTFPVQGDVEAFGIATTDTRVYVEYWDDNGTVTPANPTGYEQGVVVYGRDPSTDLFTYLTTIWIPMNNGYNITRNVVVDTASVLADGDH